MLGRLLVMLRLEMLWGRVDKGSMHIRDINVGDIDIGNVEICERKVYLLMASIMAMACWWCTSFLSSYSLNSFCQDLSHYFSLPPPNIVLHTSRPLAVLSYGPCWTAHIVLPTVRPSTVLGDLGVAQHEAGQKTA